MYEDKPWLAFYGKAPSHLEYVRGTMYEAIKRTAEKFPEKIACEFLGRKIRYRNLIRLIDRYAAQMEKEGITEDDCVTICLPNCPSVILMVYAMNKIGAVASTIHPLSTPREIHHYLLTNRSAYVMTADLLWKKFEQAIDGTQVKTVYLVKVTEEMGWRARIGASFLPRFRLKDRPQSKTFVFWNPLVRRKPVSLPTPQKNRKDRTENCAVILFSGGTTGEPKGIMCSNFSFNALAQQVGTQGDTGKGGKMLTILPNFHGFGLGVCIHMPLFWGGTVILVPNFDPRNTVRLIKKKRPEYFAGVPKLFDSLLKVKSFHRIDLSCFKGVYCGGDSLQEKTEKAFAQALRKCGSEVRLMEGYGLTESLTACMLMPRSLIKPGSIGIPFPDVSAKIVEPGTEKPIPVGQEGEICLTGPTLMIGYYNNPEATKEVLWQHSDGQVWLHTGDIGKMDSDGFFYFRYRQKRMIKIAGLAVYPSQVEELLNTHPDVLESCVIGVGKPDEPKQLKAFIILKKNVTPELEPAKREELLRFCGDHLIKWSCPKEIAFRKEFPKTLVGKVAYRELEREEQNRDAENASS